MADMMLAIAVVSVGLATLRWFPGLGVFLLFASLLAMGRTFGEMTRRRDAGSPMTFPQKAVLLSTSLVVGGVLILASTIAFVLTCTGVSMLSLGLTPVLFLGVLLGVFAAVVVSYTIRETLWPIRGAGAKREKMASENRKKDEMTLE